MGAIDPLHEPMAEAAGPGRLRAAPPFPAVLRGPRRWLFLRLVLNGTLQGAAALLLPFAILGLAAAPDGAGLAGAPGGAGLPGAVVPIGALALAVVGLRVIELSDAERLGLDYVAEMRLRLFDGLAAGLARSSHGVAMARMMNDLSALRNWVGLGLARSVSAGLALAGCLGAAVALSPQHAGAILVPLGLAAVAAVAMAGALGARVGEVRRLRGRLAKRLGEILPVLPVLRGRVALAKARGRIERAGDALVAAQIRQVRIASMLRALPDALMPGAVLAALAFGLPLGGGGASASSGAASVGLVLLAGLATGPLRQLFRALEYRAAFVVARERLAPGIVADDLGAGAAPAWADPLPGGPDAEPAAGGPLAMQAGPDAEPAAAGVPVSGVIAVSGPAVVQAGSLRRNIDGGRRYRGNDADLREIADLCGLMDRSVAPRGLASRLDPADPGLGESWRTRLALARAIAAGGRALAVGAPDLAATPEGRAILARVVRRFGLTLHPVEPGAGEG